MNVSDLIEDKRVILYLILLFLYLLFAIGYYLRRKYLGSIIWREPRWSYYPREKVRFIAFYNSISWKKVLFYLIIFSPIIYFLLSIIISNPKFHWYFFPIIFASCGIFLAFMLLVVLNIGSSKVTIDKKGIFLSGSSEHTFGIKRYPFSEVDFINIHTQDKENKVMSWRHQEKLLYRGISKKIDIANLKTVIEENSDLILDIE